MILLMSIRYIKCYDDNKCVKGSVINKMNARNNTLGVEGGNERNLRSEEAENLKVPSGIKVMVERKGCQRGSRALAVRLDAVAGLPRQARGSRLRAHLK
jgi:hypothetical protein